MPDWLTHYLWSVATSAALSTLLTAALVWLSKTWISERVKGAIEHEYAEKLETFKAEVQARHEVAIERIRADNASLASVQGTANAAFSAAHAASQERRLQALEKLWDAVGDIRKNMPLAVGLVDLLGDTPLEYFVTKPAGRSAVDQLTIEFLIGWFKAPAAAAASVRPFLDESIFQLFQAFHFVPGRIAMLIHMGVEEGKLLPWRAAADIQHVVKTVLTTDEFKDFNEQPLPLMYFMGRVEAKLLTAAGSVISGTKSGDAALESARKIAEAIAESQKGANIKA